MCFRTNVQQYENDPYAQQTIPFMNVTLLEPQMYTHKSQEQTARDQSPSKHGINDSLH